MMNSQKIYTYNDKLECQSVSVYPVLSDSSPRMDVPETEHKTGIVFSVSSVDASAYRWLKPTSKRFAEIFITVTAGLKRAFRAAERFISGRVRNLKMALNIRRPACLRL
jgi:hypothetical protein